MSLYPYNSKSIRIIENTGLVFAAMNNLPSAGGRFSVKRSGVPSKAENLRISSKPQLILIFHSPHANLSQKSKFELLIVRFRNLSPGPRPLINSQGVTGSCKNLVPLCTMQRYISTDLKDGKTCFALALSGNRRPQCRHHYADTKKKIYIY